MGSRLREKPETLFEVFTEIARPNTPEESPFILQRYPGDYPDEEVLKSIPTFAFPSDAESSTVDHFTFVLTDIDGKFKFGFCRHASGAQTCLCIVSCLPWYEIFFKLLNHLAEILNRNEDNNVDSLLQVLHAHPVLQPGDDIEVVTPSLKDKFSFVCPDPLQLPSIPENRNLTEYYNAIDTNNMILIFASMLFERRVLITSKKLSRLTACVHGAASLLYPMNWQHLYIPILPKHLVDYCSAPMPFLIGIHTSLLEKVKKQELGDAVILYCDENRVETEHEDIAAVPPDVMSQLRKQLKPHQSDKVSSSLIGDGVARTFLKTMVALIGGYRDALRFRPGEQITFDPDAFLQSRPSSMRPFLEQLMQTQTFEQFVNDRLDTLNAGEGFSSDQFDIEVNMAGDKWGTQSRYRDWNNQMKKTGKKLRRDGKDKWVEFTNKIKSVFAGEPEANPAVRHAVQTVKDKSKKTFSGIKEKIGELRKDDETGVGRGRHMITTPSVMPQRPPRPPPPNMGDILGPAMSQRQSIISRRTSYERARKYNVIDIDDDIPASPRISKRTSADDSEVYDLNLARVSVDLMGDPDIQNVFKKSYSLEDLTLEDTSLDVTDNIDDARYMENNNGVYDTNANRRMSASAMAAQNRRSRVPVKPTASKTIMRTRPTPSPRSSVNRDTPILSSPNPTRGEDSLINLEHPTIPVLRPTDLEITLGVTGQRAEAGFDPLTERAHSNPQLTSALKDIESGLEVEGSVPAPAPGPVLRHPPGSDKRPIPRPRSSIISRNNAFYKGSRPSSVRRRSPTSQATDANAMREARKQFIETDSPTTTLDPLDQFDPLISGRVAMDTSSPSAPLEQGQNQEEDLLKEWNLDFTRLRPAAPVTTTVPQTQPNISGLHPGYRATSAYPYQLPYRPPSSGAKPGTVAQRITQYSIPATAQYAPPTGGFLHNTSHTLNSQASPFAAPQSLTPRVPAPQSLTPRVPAPQSLTLPANSSPALMDPFSGEVKPAPLNSVAQSRAAWQTFD